MSKPASNLVTFRRDFIAGVDVGQVNDWTAIAILERFTAVPDLKHLPRGLHEDAKKDAEAVPMRLDLRHLERIELGTLYPEQVIHVQQLLRDPRVGGVQTFLDMTGCGRPVFDMFRLAGLPDLSGVMITGAKGTATRMPYGWNVGKSELVNQVQVEMQTGRLRFGRTIEHVDKLVRELKDFRAKQNPSGNMTFNAREGQHDDLVLALALAVFGALRPRPVTHFDLRFAS